MKMIMLQFIVLVFVMLTVSAEIKNVAASIFKILYKACSFLSLAIILSFYFSLYVFYHFIGFGNGMVNIVSLPSLLQINLD